MLINSYDLAKVAEELLALLTKAREKVNFYAKEELDKTQSTNFSLNEIDENKDVFLVKINRVLLENENVAIETELASKIKEFYSEMKDKFKEFDELLDQTHSQKNGSHNSAFFQTHFVQWFLEFYDSIKQTYLFFLDKIDIGKIINDKKKYEKIFKDAEAQRNALQMMLNDTKKKNDEIILKLQQDVSEAQNKIKAMLLQSEQVVSDKKISDIKVFYKAIEGKTEKQRKQNARGFYLTLIGLISLLVYVFFHAESIYVNKLWIPRTLLSVSLIGFLTFLMNDFRKRLNIACQILDEVEQKKLVVDTYSALLSRMDSFDEETRKNYHQKIIDNIVGTLLEIKNHGYFSKLMNKNDANILTTIVENSAEIVKAIKDK